MIVQPTNNGKVLRVLDLASPGSVKLAYLKSEPLKDTLIEIKAVQPSQVRERFTADGNVRLALANGMLPNCLTDEPPSYYDHVHLHMLTGEDTEIGRKDFEKIIDGIPKVMATGGTFFFSADNTIFSQKEKMELYMEQKALLRTIDCIITEKFRVVYRLYTPFELTHETEEKLIGEKFTIASIRSSEMDEICKIFGIDECDGTIQVIAKQVGTREIAHIWSAKSLFYDFRDDGYSTAGEYFVVAKKKE